MIEFHTWPARVLALFLGPALLFSGCNQVPGQSRPDPTVTALSGLPRPQINTLAPTPIPGQATPHSGPQAMDSGSHSPTPPLSATALFTDTPPFTTTPTADPLACLEGLSPPEYAEVQWVISGDTIVVMRGDQRKSVRYLGIDAPSYVPNIRFIGPPALQRNRELVQGQIVTLYRDGPDTDAIGQLLRYVVVNDLFVNYELSRYGLARTISGATGLYPSGAPNQPDEGQACRAVLLQAEQNAREERIGMWTDEAVVAELATEVGVEATVTEEQAAATPVMGQSTPEMLSTTAPVPATTGGPTTAIGTSTPTLQPTLTTTLQPAATNTPSSSGNQPPVVLQHSPTLPVLTHTPTPTPTNGQSSGSPAPSATNTYQATYMSQASPTPTLTPSPSQTLMPTRTGTLMPTVPSIPFLTIADLLIEGDPVGNEADEYVEIINEYTFDIDLTGFQVIVKTTGVTFTFPQFTLEAGEACRVYTNQVQPDSCVQDSFRSQTPIWGNPDHADCAQLFDAYGQMWDQYCY